jgi:hypothetical protein
MDTITGRLMKLKAEADYYPEASLNPDDLSDAIRHFSGEPAIF